MSDGDKIISHRFMQKCILRFSWSKDEASAVRVRQIKRVSSEVKVFLAPHLLWIFARKGAVDFVPCQVMKKYKPILSKFILKIKIWNYNPLIWYLDILVLLWSIHNLYFQSTYFLHVMGVYCVNNLESVGLKPKIHFVHECADGKQKQTWMRWYTSGD